MKATTLSPARNGNGRLSLLVDRTGRPMARSNTFYDGSMNRSNQRVWLSTRHKQPIPPQYERDAI